MRVHPRGFARCICDSPQTLKEWAVGEDRGIVAFEGFVLARVRRRTGVQFSPPALPGSNKGFPNLREKSSGFFCSPGLGISSGHFEDLGLRRVLAKDL